MSRFIFAIFAVIALSFSSLAMAKPVSDIGTVPIPVDKSKYRPEIEPVFNIQHYINENGVNIYSVTEDFGLLNIESDVFLDHPIQEEKEHIETRDMLLDFGYQIAHYLVPKLYGVKTHDIHVGNVYIGKPSMSPDGSITLVDVKFIRDGLLYRSRVGIMSTDVEGNDPADQMWFIYPYTRQ